MPPISGGAVISQQLGQAVASRESVVTRVAPSLSLNSTHSASPSRRPFLAQAPWSRLAAGWEIKGAATRRRMLESS